MQIKNVTLSATTETEITIEQGYPYVWFKNLGDNTVYVSASPDILDNGSVKTEGVSTITSGECTSVTTKSDKVYAYALGATIVEVHAQGNPESSFKIKAKGGESSITVEPILITQNGEYTAPEGKAYSPVNVQTPVYNITPLTLTHNHQGADAGLYGGYSPVEVQIEMDTLNAPSNGVYEIDENTQDGWDTVLVDTYEKYNELFFSSGNNYSPQVLTDDITDTDYDELWVTGYYLYGDGTGNHIALWSCRYPTDALFPSMLGTYIFGGGSHNHLWVQPTDDNYFVTAIAEYDYPYMYIGIKNKDKEQDLLWENTESTTPSTITLSESIFDYDEVCFYFYKDVGTSNVASWYLTSEISVGDIIQGYDDNNVSKYTIASNTTLTVLSEGSNGYKLRAVYGIKDNSIQKTTLFTNPSDSTIPATVTLSDAYTNYDEFVLVGHYISDGTKCSNSYPVKAFGKRGLDATQANDRIGLFTTQEACWLAFTSTTTLVPDTTAPSVIVDKIIGIKRPVVSTAHELIDVVPLTANSNGTYTAPTGTAYSPVTVDVQEQPSGASPKAVNFYDYDGTIVQSYSAAEFAELTEMPENPTHDGLTSQGWNWSLVDAKTYVASYGKLNIGQIYITNDGVTRLYIRLADGRLSPALGLCPNGTLTIDWGDETPAETMTGTSVTTLVYLSHTYSQVGEYTISITPASSSTFAFGGRTSASTVLCKSDSDSLNERIVYLNTIININLGDGITSVDNFAFANCNSLSSITIPNSVTTIGSNAFANCNSLSSITISNNVTLVNNKAFNSCRSLSSITIPNRVTTITSDIFYYCSAFSSITIPNSVTTIGSNAFIGCSSFSSIIIPNSVTTIQSGAFSYCYGLGYLKFTNATPPRVSINTFTLIPTDCIIYVPEGSLTAYKSADNYPDPNTYTYVEY